MFQRKTTLKELTAGFNIPPRPQVLAEINTLIDDPDFELTDLANPITQDIGISASVLKVVNSSINGLNRTISDISQAVCFLGVEQIKAIISICKLRENFPDSGEIKLERFWDECTQVASLMLFINKWLGNKYQPDLLYTLGMFRDCGIAAMAYKYPGYMQVLKEANDSNEQLLVAFENEKFNTDHSTVGYFIASSWHFPKDVCRMIRYHHDLDAFDKCAPQHLKPYVGILQLAEGLTHKISRFEEHAYFEANLNRILGWLELSDDEYNDLCDEVEAILM